MVDIQTLETFGIRTNVLFEDFEVQFTTLLKSADAANERIREYAEFGAATPFNLPEIVQAGKLLQTFGGEVLATGDALTMVGDMASASGSGFSNVAMWVGRAYSAMQSGRPFGEAAARLQELGLMSGEARNKLETLQKSGASTAEQWAAFTEVMSKFNGMMEMQSATLGGMRSNLEDYEEQIALVGGAPLFEAEKDRLKNYLAYLEQGDPFEQAADKMGTLKDALSEGDEITFEQTARELERLGMITSDVRKEIVTLQQAGAEETVILAAVDSEKIEEGTVAIEKFKKSLTEDREIPLQASITQMERLGVITTETADKLRAMREEGATAEQILDVSGLETNKDLIGEIAQGVGLIKASFVQASNEWKQSILDALPLDRISEFVEKLAELASKWTVVWRTITQSEGDMLGDTLDFLVNGLTLIADILIITVDRWQQMAATGRATMAMLGIVFEEVRAPIMAVIGDIDALIGLLTGQISFEEFGQKIAESFSVGFDIVEVGRKALDAYGESMAESELIRTQAEASRQRYIDGIEDEAEATQSLTEVINEEALARQEALAGLQARTEGYYDEFLEIQEQAAKEAEAMEQQHQDRMTSIGDNAQAQQAAAMAKRDDALAQLTTDTAKRRQELTERADESIAKMRENRQREEQRSEEDHQRDMDRRRRAYLSNLQDAVKNRDARAIVDLRKRYKEEKNESETGFQQQQTRRDEDARRAEQDAQTNRDRELAKLNEQEELKRQAIWNSFQQQQVQIADQAAQMMEKENAGYAQRQEAANVAAQARLEKIAESLSKDNEVTEEGARVILDTLNTVFGAGGDVDALMEEFAQRRRTRMEIEIEVKKIFKGLGEEEEYGGGMAMIDRGGGILTPGGGREFQTGGLLLARSPTIVSVGEHEPEIFSAAPLKSLSTLQGAGIGGPRGGESGGEQTMRLLLEVSGSAPPGIGTTHRDDIANVMISAMREAGWLVERR
jgi:hypothetical protein